MTIALVIHGGAGFVKPDEYDFHLEGVEAAAEAGRQALLAGKSALEAVEIAVTVLEDHPAFDAGRGSVLNSAGEIEVDAMIMDGLTLRAGAVAAVKEIANPVQLARMVMQKTRHNMLVGAGAVDFAVKQGVPLIDQSELMVPGEIERYQRNLAALSEQPQVTGTVGAVAMDAQGNIAAATSTGGVEFKMPGRVGDSPLIGCGTYADNEAGGASATGYGERIMELVLSKYAVDLMRSGMDAQSAASDAIAYLDRRVKGTGGIILVDKVGRIGFAHSTAQMPVAWIDESGAIRVQLTTKSSS